MFKRDIEAVLLAAAREYPVVTLFEQNRQIIPIEIKSAMTWNSDFVDGVRWLAKAIPDTAPGFVVYAGELMPVSDDCFSRQQGKIGGGQPCSRTDREIVNGERSASERKAHRGHLLP